MVKGNHLIIKNTPGGRSEMIYIYWNVEGAGDLWLRRGRAGKILHLLKLDGHSIEYKDVAGFIRVGTAPPRWKSRCIELAKHKHIPNKITMKGKHTDEKYVLMWCVVCGAIRVNDVSPWKMPSGSK